MRKGSIGNTQNFQSFDNFGFDLTISVYVVYEPKKVQNPIAIEQILMCNAIFA